MQQCVCFLLLWSRKVRNFYMEHVVIITLRFLFDCMRLEFNGKALPLIFKFNEPCLSLYFLLLSFRMEIIEFISYVLDRFIYLFIFSFVSHCIVNLFCWLKCAKKSIFFYLSKYCFCFFHFLFEIEFTLRYV